MVASDILDARQLIEGLRRLLEAEAPPARIPSAPTHHHNQKDSQLTYAIMQCRSVEQLAGIVGQHEHSLNALHLSAVASKLSSLMASPCAPNSSNPHAATTATSISSATPGAPPPVDEQQVPPYQRRRARRQQQQQQLDAAANVGRGLGSAQGGAASGVSAQQTLPQLLQRLEELVLERLEVSPPASGVTNTRSSSSSSGSRRENSNSSNSSSRNSSTRRSEKPDVPTDLDSQVTSSSQWQARSIAPAAPLSSTDDRLEAIPFSSVPASAQASHGILFPPQTTPHAQQHHSHMAAPRAHHRNTPQTCSLLPDKLGPRQLSTAVHGLAKAGHRPSREWMSQVLEASQVLLQRHTLSVQQGGGEKGGDACSSGSSSSSSSSGGESNGAQAQNSGAQRSNSTLSSSSKALLEQLAARTARKGVHAPLQSHTATPASTQTDSSSTSTSGTAPARQTTSSNSNWSNLSSSSSSSSVGVDSNSWGGRPLPAMGTRKSKFTGQELSMLAWGLARMHQREQEEIRAARTRRLQRIGSATAHNSQQQQQLLLQEVMLSERQHSHHHQQQQLGLVQHAEGKALHLKQQREQHQHQHLQQASSSHRDLILRRPVWPRDTHQSLQLVSEELPGALFVPQPELLGEGAGAHRHGTYAGQPLPARLERARLGSSVEAGGAGPLGSAGLPLPSAEWGQALCGAVLTLAAPQHHQQHHQHHMHSAAGHPEGVSSRHESSQSRWDSVQDSMAASPSLSAPAWHGSPARPTLSPSATPGISNFASPRCTPQDVSLISWAMAILKVHPSPPFMAQWLKVCSSQMSAMSGMDVAQLAWALAKLQYRPLAAWMQTLAARAAQLAQQNQLKPRDIANFLWALGKLRFDPGAAVLDPLLSALPGDQHKGVAAYKPMDAANVLWALGVLRRKPAPSAMLVLLAAVCDGPSPLSQQELSNILWSLARLSYAPSLLTQRALISQLHRLLSISILGPSALAQLAWALPRLRMTLPHPVQQRLATAMLAAAPRMNTHGLLLSLEWVHRCGVQLLPSHVDSLTSRALAKLLEGLTRARRNVRLASRRAALLAHKAMRHQQQEQRQQQQHSAAPPSSPQGRLAPESQQAVVGQVQLSVPSSAPYLTTQPGQQSLAPQAQPPATPSEPQPQNVPHAHLSHANTEDHSAPTTPCAPSHTQGSLGGELTRQPVPKLPHVSLPQGGLQQCGDTSQQNQQAQLVPPRSPRYGDHIKPSDRPADPKAHVLAQLLWVTVKLGRPLLREQLDDLLHSSIMVLPCLQPREVCAISWALAQMKHRPSTEWMRCWLGRARKLQQAGVLSPKQQALLYKCSRLFRAWNKRRVPASLQQIRISLPSSPPGRSSSTSARPLHHSPATDLPNRRSRAGGQTLQQLQGQLQRQQQGLEQRVE